MGSLVLIRSQTMRKILYAPMIVCLGAGLSYAKPRQKRQTNFGNGSRQPSFSNNQPSNTGTSGTNTQTGNKIFFGNPAIDNGLLGAGLGIGGILLAQNIANSNNQCNCGGRRKRQIQTQDPNQKFFGLFGGGNSNSNCNCAASSGIDCKGRPQGDQFYECGCNGRPNGGFFSFGRKKRQIQQPGEDVNNRFLNFRCIQATLTGRNTNQG